MMNYNHFYYFFVTAKLGGVSNASKYLHVSQPSLSSQLKVFENAIGQKLFEKRGRNLALTAEGERAFSYAKKIFELAADFNDSLQTNCKCKSRNCESALRIKSSALYRRSFSPLLRYQNKGVEKSFFVSSAPSEILLNQLRQEEIDLVLTNKPLYAEDVKELVSASMPVNLLVATRNLKEFKIRTSRHTSAADFLDIVPWGLVIPSYKMKLRHETDLFIQEINSRKKIVFESDIMSVVGRAIVDGAGVGFLPVPYVLDEVKSNILTVLGPKAGYWKHTLYLLGRKSSHYDETVEGIKAAVRGLVRF